MNFNILLFFSSLTTIYYDVLHTRRFIGRCNKLVQTNPVHSNRRYVSLSDRAEKNCINFIISAVCKGSFPSTLTGHTMLVLLYLSSFKWLFIIGLSVVRLFVVHLTMLSVAQTI
jgi:hypothetical protein